MAPRGAVLARNICMILFLIFNKTRSEGKLAVGKVATQSTNQDNNKWLAIAAVDGCENNWIESNCCTHTKNNQKKAWWRVDLGQISTINTIKIIYRENFQQRLAGYQLHVSNTTDTPPQGVLCYEDKSSTRSEVELKVTHQCPYVARYVAIYNYRNNPKRYSWYYEYAILELCEVQVFGCSVGYYGDGDCNQACPGNCYGGNCNPKTGSCMYCFPGKYGDACDKDCPTNCKNSLCDKESGDCLECINGKYGNTCNLDCPVNCKDRCVKDTGHCTECIVGKYDVLCDQDCSVNCKDSLCAKENGYCTECVDGQYGNTCNLMCSVNCDNGLCAKESGICIDCVLGKHGNTCDQDCPVNCKDRCARYTGYCTECIIGKYGNACDPDCSRDCKDSLCAMDTGFCTGECNAGKYGNTCNLICSVNCQNGFCEKDSGTCTGCTVGKHGDTCDEDCPMNCKDNVCGQETGLCDGCTVGKHGDTCNEDCPVNCKDNVCGQETGLCDDCITGKYSSTCNQNCSSSCENRICAISTGHCVACVPTKRGETCELDCPQNCLSGVCDKNSASCTNCITGKYSSTCNQNCSSSCENRICAISTGHCVACVPTKRGETCELDCPQNCLSGVCDKNSASCTSCVEGYYGTNCSIHCSRNCSECDQGSGQCTTCNRGLYGMNCSMSCGHCGVCGLDTGLCETECDPGYEGGFCKKRQVQSVPPTTPTTDAGPIVGAIIAVLLVVVVAIVIVIFIRRRRLRDSKQDSFDDIGRSKVNERNIYEEPLETVDSHANRGTSEKNIYSNTLVSEDDPDETPKDTANVYVNAEQVARKSNTGDSVYYNSGPVGFPVSKLKTLVQTKMQNKAKAFENEYKSIPSGALHEHNIGMLQQNKAKNRFKTTFPYDHSRVILDTIGRDPHSDYINANYIDSVTKTAEYIATQGPRPGTVNDFWRMIWQLKSSKIIMLTNIIEGGKPKCDKYWPDEGEPLSTTHFNVVLDRERAYAFYVIRDLVVTEKKTKSVRQIHQFHYTTWPDHGTPDPNELVVFHRRVKQYGKVLTGKMVVHCSAGIGRTGTFLALDALLDYGKESGRIDVMQYVKTMRKDRINMVQTAEQYIAIHQLLVEAFDMPDTLIPRMKYHTTLSALSNDGPTNQTKLRKEYQLTQILKPKYAATDCKSALLPTNKKKNSTLTVLAVDKFRAYLRSQASERTDYINAIAVPSYTSKTGYIVTQTPMDDTVVDLLTMVMDHNCQTIVVIDTDAIDWLPEQDEVKTIGEFTLKQKGKSSTIANVDLLEIAIINQGNDFDTSVRVFHLSGWGRGSSVPEDSSMLLQLLELLDSRRKSDDTKTTVVMCRDGYSQSGLFCCISNARDQMKSDEEVDIFQISRQLLVRRPEFLTNFEQYQCCYNMIRDYLDTTDVYMN